VTFEQIIEKHWIVKRNKHGVDLVLIRKEQDNKNLLTVFLFKMFDFTDAN
jgi:hypothetical protein